MASGNWTGWRRLRACAQKVFPFLEKHFPELALHHREQYEKRVAG
jgi:hypothetical protein